MGESDDTAAPLPKSVELLWGLSGPGTRGPKRGLSLVRIVEAAVAVADAEGFAALSMNRVAQELGFTTMSLYRYVDSKDTLVELLYDRIVGTPPPIPAGTPWRPALETWVWGQFQEFRRHPWMLDIPMTAPPIGPNNMNWLEAGLAAMADIPIPEPVKLQLLLNLSLYVIGRLRLLKEMGPTSGAEGDYNAVLTKVLDPQRYPSITAALSHQAFDQDELTWEEADFRFCLERLLDGYAQYIGTFSPK